MDSWSRPGKRSAAPPPLYITQGDAARYCQSCGRIMSSATKAATSKLEDKKYCSSRCRSQKPGPLDRRIEDAFVRLLLVESKFEHEMIPEAVLTRMTKPRKGESRVVIPCSAVEALIFGSRYDQQRTKGRSKNHSSRVLADDEEESDGRSAQMVHFTAQEFAGELRPPQNLADACGSIDNESRLAERSEESDDTEARRKEGMRLTEEKERVKRAARRGVIFGFAMKDAMENGIQDKSNASQPRRKCEAIMNGSVVEPSFAKGDWGIRWRE